MDYFVKSHNLQKWSSTFSNDSREDLGAQEKFLDSSSAGRDSMEESPEQALANSLDRERKASKQRRSARILTAFNIVLFGTTLAVGGLNYLALGKEEMNHCVKETSYYSPIFDAKKIEFTDVHLNGTLWPPENEAWSRKVPGDEEAERKWEEWEPVDTFPITREQVIALGKDPETVARYPDEYWGMGDNAYIASLDVLHKIHCVNELRKMSFADYGDTNTIKELKQHGQLWWIHLRHCVDMVTQDLLCHADADLITYNWRDTQRHPFPDFGINRKCRSIEPLLEYRDERKVDMRKYVAMPKPESGITQVPYEPGYYAMYGFDGSDLYGPNGEGYPGVLPDTDVWFGIKPNITELNSGQDAHNHHE